MKKILVSDYDKTFYLNDKDIKKNIEFVDEFRKRDNLFIFATGRSYFDFKKKVLEYALKYDYVIIDHGAMILDSKDDILNVCYINDDVIDSIKKDLKLEDAINTFCCSELESRVDFEHKKLTKINVTYYDNEIAEIINKKINEKYKDYVVSYMINSNMIEIVSNKISKAKAIELLINRLEISSNNVYTIGDGYSDIEMCKNYNGYCMKDAVEDLKKVSTKEMNSVSELIEELL